MSKPDLLIVLQTILVEARHASEVEDFVDKKRIVGKD
jgi:hypothetical protein